MKQCNNEQKFYGTEQDFRTFLKTYEFKQIDKKFNSDSTFIDKHANMVRMYSNNKALSAQGKIWWRYIPYDGSTCLTNAGYKLVTVNGKQYTMHQIMAHTWLYNYDPVHMTDVDHIDGNKTNNELNNLRWCTKKENMANYWGQKAAKIANGEVGLNNFIKKLKSQVMQEYKPETRLVLNLKLNKKENNMNNSEDLKTKFIELYESDDCSEEQLEKEMDAIKAYLKSLKEDKNNGK